RELELEDHGARIGRLDARHRRVVVLSDAAHALRWKQDLVVAGLDVGRGQRRAVVEPDARTYLERVREPVGRDLPVARDISADVRVAVWIDLEQRAVEGGHRL